MPQLWVTHEALILPVALSNAGPPAHEVAVSLRLDPNIEPLSSVDLYFTDFPSQESKQLHFMLTAAKPGQYSRYVSASVSCRFDDKRIAQTIPIAASTTFLTPSQALRSNEQTSTYPRLQEKLQGLVAAVTNLDDLETLLKLMDVDAKATIVKCRSLLEAVVNRLIAKSRLSLGNMDLETKLRRLRDNGVVDNKLFGWMNTVRILGNVMVHDQQQPIQASKDDALVTVSILLNVLEEILAKGLLA